MSTDLTGKRFGRWVVLALYPQRDRWGATTWSCRCECGTERIVLGHNLRNGRSTSCGCAHREAKRFIDLAGERLGRWTVLAPQPQRNSSRQVLWLCRCDCGTERVVLGRNLRDGSSTSCGCAHREAAAKRATRHGLSRSRAYRCWLSMKQRCFNPDHIGYVYYGGRGISVHEDWLSFEKFFADMLDPPPGLSIDRIDNDGNYEPGNCRWATPAMQIANRRPPARSNRSAVRAIEASPTAEVKEAKA